MIAFVAAVAMGRQALHHDLEGVKKLMIVVESDSWAFKRGHADARVLENTIRQKLKGLGVSIVQKAPMADNGGPITGILNLIVHWRELDTERDRCYFEVRLECVCHIHAPGPSKYPSVLALWYSEALNDSSREEFPKRTDTLTAMMMDRFLKAYRESNP